MIVVVSSMCITDEGAASAAGACLETDKPLRNIVKELETISNTIYAENPDKQTA